MCMCLYVFEQELPSFKQDLLTGVPFKLQVVDMQSKGVSTALDEFVHTYAYQACRVWCTMRDPLCSLVEKLMCVNGKRDMFDLAVNFLRLHSNF